MQKETLILRLDTAMESQMAIDHLIDIESIAFFARAKRVKEQLKKLKQPDS